MILRAKKDDDKTEGTERERENDASGDWRQGRKRIIKRWLTGGKIRRPKKSNESQAWLVTPCYTTTYTECSVSAIG